MKVSNTSAVLPPSFSSQPSTQTVKPVQQSLTPTPPPKKSPANTQTEKVEKKSLETETTENASNLDWKNTLKKLDLQQEATLDGKISYF